MSSIPMMPRTLESKKEPLGYRKDGNNSRESDEAETERRPFNREQNRKDLDLRRTKTRLSFSAELQDLPEISDLEFDSGEDDEEIDEDLAFTTEDKKQFSHMFEKEEAPLESTVVVMTDHPDDVDVMFGDDEELEELFTEDEEEMDDGLLQKALQIKSQKSKTIRQTVLSESRPEGLLGMPTAEPDEGLVLLPSPSTAHLVGIDASKVDGLANLTASLDAGPQSMWRGARKSVEKLEKQAALAAPLPKRIQDRQIRKAGYAYAVEDMSKWDDIVYANRIAPTIEFGAPDRGSQHCRTLEDMVESFEPETEMECEIAAMLKESGAASEEKIVEMENERALKSMSLADLKQKRTQLAKMRSLLFEHEIKAKHLKRIKSKGYHRRLQRSIRKKAMKISGLDSDAAAKKLLEEMSYNRMKERLTQKHSTKNRFAKRIMRRGWGVADEETKQALEEQLRQSQELKQRMESTQKNSADDDSSSSDDGDATDQEKTRKALLNVLRGNETQEEVPKKGLIGLPFMQRSIQRRKTETRLEAEKMLDELDGSTEAKDPKQPNSRMEFRGGNAQNEAESSESDADNEKRLGRTIQKLGKMGVISRRPSCTLERQSPELEIDQQSQAKNITAHEFHFRNSDRASKTSAMTEKRDSGVQDNGTHTVDGVTDVAVVAENTEAANGNNAATLSQTQLIELAFAEDSVKDDFAEEKAHEIGKELPKSEEVTLLPGWGRWKDEQTEPKWMQEKRDKNTKIKERALRKRRDAKKPFVFISEKANSQLDKYKISRVPHTFASEEAYKASLRHPLGPDFNTAAAFDDFIRPKVLTKRGVIIEPLKLSRNARELREQVKEGKKGNVKIRKIIDGEVQSNKKLRTAEK